MSSVTVGCKLPNGITLHLGEHKVTLKGSNSSAIVGGHGITEGVDSAFMETWMAQNSQLDFVKRGFIFSHESKPYVEAQAGEFSTNRTGLEPMDPMKPGQGLEATDESKNFMRKEGITR